MVVILLKFSAKPTVIVPKDQRYVDTYFTKVRTVDEMTKKELAIEKEMNELSKDFQDVQSSHPLLEAEEKKRNDQIKKLEPDRLAAVAQFEKLQNKKAKAMVKDMNELAQQEGFIKDLRAKSQK
jgi:hypothetical protein